MVITTRLSRGCAASALAVFLLSIPVPALAQDVDPEEARPSSLEDSDALTQDVDSGVAPAGSLAASDALAQDADSGDAGSLDVSETMAQDADSGDVGSLDTSELVDMSLEEILSLNVDVTTVSKSAEKISDAPGVITVVTRDELQRFGGTTLAEILNRVPSLLATSTYFTDRSTIAARGDQLRFDSAHVLILINGRPTREILQGGNSSDVYEAFPIHIIERIEVIKGPGSVLYGSSAFSGVVNIITEQAKDGVATSASLIGGAPWSYGGSGEVKLKQGDFSLVLAGRALKKADWPIDYHLVDPATQSPVTVQRDIPNRGGGGYLELDYKGLRLMSAFTEWETMYFVFSEGGHVGRHRWRRGFADLSYHLPVSEAWNWDMDFHATYTQMRFKLNDRFPFIKRSSHDVVGEWTNLVRPRDDLHLIFGGLFSYIKGMETSVAGEEEMDLSDDGRSGYGMYAQLDYRPIESLKLVGGLQLNKTKNVAVDVVPRAGIIWYPWPELNVKALYGQAFLAPSINEFGLSFPNLQGKSDIKPEKVQTIDAGINYLGETIQAGVNYFYTQQRDIIGIDFTAVPYSYDNLGKYEFQGAELEVKYYLMRSIFLTGSMLYFESKDLKATGEQRKENITPVANLGAKAGASYRSDKGITAGLFYIYQGDVDKAYDATLNPDPGQYHLVNLHCAIDLATLLDLDLFEGVTFFAEGDNLLDEVIYVPDSGSNGGESLPFNRGRTIYFGAQVAYTG